MSGIYALRDQRLVRVDKVVKAPSEMVKPVAVDSPLSQPGVFFRSLAFLLKSGLPLNRSMRLLGDGMALDSDRAICWKLERLLNEGMSLSRSFTVAGFPQMLTSALEAGEVSGRLEQAMEWYADFEENNQAIRREIKQALWNPTLTLVFSLLFAVLLPPLVLRDQLVMLEQSGTPMPLLSKLMLAFTELFYHPGCLLLLPAGFLAYRAFRGWIATVGGRRRFERALQRIPLVRDALRRAAGARCLSLMAMILQSGGSPMAAMLIGGQGSGSRLLKDRLQLSVHSLVGGVPFTQSLAKTSWFLRSSLDLIEAGELVGDTSEMMVMAARMEEEKLRDALAMVAAVAQPAALLLIGSLVCAMVIAVLGPSLALISNV